MKFRKPLISLLIFLVCHVAISGPARPGIYTFVQPDGSTFQGRYRGDEFIKIKTTIDGHSIIMDDEGWWCYAFYDSNGHKQNTGLRVGQNVPGHILHLSSDIPYSTLTQRVRQKRSIAHRSDPIIPQLLAGEAFTKSETAVTKHAIIILAQYQDVEFRYTRQDFVNLLTQEGGQSAKDYFESQFNGAIRFEFDISEIVTLDYNRAYYGENDWDDSDIRPAQMAEEACRKANKAGVDFSKYDDNNDGKVDNVFIFFAGEDEAQEGSPEECIWSHAWYISSGAGLPEVELDGKIIDSYACTAELGFNETLAGIGSFCHEYSHTFGLPDFYDTDYEESGGWASGLWYSTSLMDAGNYNNNSKTPPFYNAIEREILKISDAVIIERNGTYRMEPIHKGGKFYRLNTDREDEYYLFECRSAEGWDQYIGGSGMLVYHIDKSDITRWNYTNEVNVDPAHQCADLIEADNRVNDLTNGYNPDISSIFYPYGSNNRLTADSTPSLSFWSGKGCEVSISDIIRSGSDIMFKVSGFAGDPPPSPKGLRIESFMDAAIIQFESDRIYEGEATIIWGLSGKEENITKVKPYEPGRYSLTLEGLQSGNKTYSVSVFFEMDEMAGGRMASSFMTSRKAPVDWPYIYLGKAAMNKSDGIPYGTDIALRVYNATDAEEIRWTFEGKHIEASANGYFNITESGQLKAYIYWEDGSLDILEKNIKVKQ